MDVPAIALIGPVVPCADEGRSRITVVSEEGNEVDLAQDFKFQHTLVGIVGQDGDGPAVDAFFDSVESNGEACLFAWRKCRGA